MESFKKALPPSLRNTNPSDVKLHVFRVQAEAMSRQKDYDGARVSWKIELIKADVRFSFDIPCFFIMFILIQRFFSSN